MRHGKNGSHRERCRSFRDITSTQAEYARARPLPTALELQPCAPNQSDGQGPTRNSAEAMTDNLLALWDRAWPNCCGPCVNTLWLVFLGYELLRLVYG